MAAPKKKPSRKKKAIRHVSQGRVYVQATYNNTIVTFTDLNGNTLAWASAGNCGFKGPKKSTPYAASVIVKSAAEKVRESGIRDVFVFVKGVGSGRDSAVRSLNANGFNVTGIKDMTPVPHNGCRAAGARRV
ncbi:MAG: 30S ribosomal protein S11 [Candidatus Uhrbacteria bacterium]|nr:30S ribosomal protein S11 [Patescibacteria group bacterium]MBU1906746.1 30S ribosomal protein S11 [Patescibacteria group bacterium]